jgi:threonine synthase
MLYRSTRDTGATPHLATFEEAVMTGLAPDGGLYVPANALPSLPADFLTAYKTLSYESLCARLCRLFIDPNELSDVVLEKLVGDAYASFTHPDRTPVRLLRDNLYILELFHGPTLAFKDVALQLLGQFFAHFLSRSPTAKRLTVVGATSGDTGGAAIYGLRGKPNIDVVILHPHNRVSPIQAAQMTSVLDANVHNVAVEGTFDDCQDLVKRLFGDVEFQRLFRLGAVNSINWARILAQIVYYFYAYFRVCKQRGLDPETRPLIDFVVPTGNFGSHYCGWCI